MPSSPSALLAYQHDIYIRYAFLSELIQAALLPSKGTPLKEPASLRILDIGCGPERLTERFLPSGVSIVRADVDQFGDPNIIQLVPGEPLPFDNGMFDVVVAMDVLEHVPTEGRAALLAECQRVAARAVVLCCPTDDPAVAAAERDFQNVVRHLTGNSLPFLDEHAGLGLPSVDLVLSNFAPDWPVMVVENAPIDHWLLFNIVDFLYAKDLSGSPEKQAFNTAVNADSRFWLPGQPHYRRFFCAFRNSVDRAAAETYLRSADLALPDDGRMALHAFARHLPVLRDDLRRSLEEAVTLKDRLIEQQSTHIETLTGLLTVPTNQDLAEQFNAKIDALSQRVVASSEQDNARVDVLSQRVAASSEQANARVEALSQRVAASSEQTNARVEALSQRTDDLYQMLRIIDANTRKKENVVLRLLRLEVWRSWYRGSAGTAWRVKAVEAARGGRAMVPLLRLTPHRGMRERFQLARTLWALKASSLFQQDYYNAENPDVAASGIPPLLHYVEHGWREGRKPNPHFDPAFYVRNNPDVAASGGEPLTHYLQHGWREGRRPNPRFEPASYLEMNPDVAASGIEPLTHYIQHGWREGRRTGLEAEEGSTEPGEMGADPVYVPPVGLLPWFSPLNLRTDPSLAGTPHLNVLVPGLAMKHMSGGPNTAVNLAYRLAALGVSVRFVATDAPIDTDADRFWQHVRSLSGVDRALPNATLIDASNRTKPLSIGANDVFMATAWWTAQMAKYAVTKTNHRRFVYLIQDYEPLLHPASTQAALAEETYALDHVPVINTSFLKEFMVEGEIGRFADPAFADRAIVFEPAVDQTRFHAVETSGKRRTLLFYARPTNGLRNLFELGVAALQKAIHDGEYNPAEWDFIGMGESFAPVPLGSNAWLRPAPWLDFDGYARQMRESDVVLSLMMSPHPSYPPIEMALCGKPAVTTVFANKTAERLAEVSPNIIGVEATIESIAGGLAEARRRLLTGACRRDPHGTYPGDWDSSFATTVPRLFEELLGFFNAPALPNQARIGAEAIFPGYRFWPANAYELQRFTILGERAPAYDDPEPGLISFLTPVWNTDPDQLTELAESVFGQDCGPGFEWIILDNNSERAETKAVLARLAQHPNVALYQSDKNLGIIKGTRYCLERARNRYIATLDHDDLLTPDCVRVVTSALKKAGYPAVAYTDEDKVLGRCFRDPYYKPDWDPVLFANSCYIAHLLCVDRTVALALDAYGDPETEGSHDWDTFTRFYRAGYTPRHIPEVVYSWRMHEQSTALNIHSKSYIAASQRAVLEKFLGDQHGRYTVEPSPLFDNTPDWMFTRTHEAPQPLTTVILHADGATPAPKLDPAIPHEVVQLPDSASLADLLDVALSCIERGRLVHLLWAGVEVEGTDWPWQAMACFELFSDTAIVGGRIHQGEKILSAGAYLGFNRGCDTPDVGRSLRDPGYFAQMFKMRTVNAVPVQHCIVSAAFLAEALPGLARAGVGFSHLGAWLGAAAGERRLRVVYSPFLLGRANGAAAELDSQVPEVERVAFRIAYADHLPDRALLSPRLGLTPETAYQPLSRDKRQRQEERVRAAGASSYPEEAEAALMARLARHPLPFQPFSISVLTIVYEKTPIEHFQTLARSLFEQTIPFTEWVLLRNGPVPASLQAVLTELVADPRVRLLDSDANLGIINGLRRCLEAAGSNWVLPVDGDDLLVKDALQQIALTVEKAQPAFVYSDEDIIRATVVESPFRRPDFDPVLNVADSYIWHACAFMRDKAMELDVYGDAGAEYCQDWDTVARFALAGEVIAHVPAILYHWRHHPQSFSNSGAANDGSRRSAERVMSKVIAVQATPSLYEIGAFPISRGLEQSAILRRPVSPLPMEAILLAYGGTPAETAFAVGADVASLCHPIRTVSDMGAACSISRLVAVLSKVSAAHVMILREDLRVDDALGLWEAMRLFEMHSDVALVGGRVFDEKGSIVECGTFAGPGQTAYAPWLGLKRNDPGPFAMALKPQSAVSVSGSHFFADIVFLRDALKKATDADLRVIDLGRFLGNAAQQQNRRVAYSPLVEATLNVR